MKRLLLPALLALTAACANPRADEITATRASLPPAACPASDVIDGCPQPSEPAMAAQAGHTAASIGGALTRSLMRLF